MIFKNIYKKTSKVGAKRNKKKFAWFPVRVSDDKYNENIIVFMESYIQPQVYTEKIGLFGLSKYFWKNSYGVKCI